MSFKVKDKKLWKKLGEGKTVEVEFAQQGKDYVVTKTKRSGATNRREARLGPIGRPCRTDTRDLGHLILAVSSSSRWQALQ